MRDHEAAAASVGINLARTKVLAFALSAMYAGIAGSLSVLVVQNASGDDKLVTFQLSIEFLVAVVIGGTATVLGPIIGGFAVVYIQKWATDAFPSKPVVSPGDLRHRAHRAHVRACPKVWSAAFADFAHGRVVHSEPAEGVRPAPRRSDRSSSTKRDTQ